MKQKMRELRIVLWAGLVGVVIFLSMLAGSRFIVKTTSPEAFEAFRAIFKVICPASRTMYQGALPSAYTPYWRYVIWVRTPLGNGVIYALVAFVIQTVKKGLKKQPWINKKRYRLSLP
jgi:hypothetical protein